MTRNQGALAALLLAGAVAASWYLLWPAEGVEPRKAVFVNRVLDYAGYTLILDENMTWQIWN